MMYGVRNKLVAQGVKKDPPADYDETANVEKTNGDEKTPKPRVKAKKVNDSVKATKKTNGKSVASSDEINHDDGDTSVEVPSTPQNKSPALSETANKRASPTKRKAKKEVDDEFGGELPKPAKKVKQSESAAEE